MRSPTAGWRTLLTIVAASNFWLAPTNAQTFDVKQIDVTKGAIDYGPETMFAAHPPREANRHVNEQALFYGLTDWWKISGALKFEKPTIDDLRMDAASVGSIFVLKALDEKHPRDFGLGWYTEVSASTHEATTNSVLFGFIPTIKHDKLTLTGNPFFEKTFGRNREQGIAFAYGWQLKYELREGLGVGVEGFGVVEDLGNSPSFSEQEHRVGPVIYTEWEIAKDRKIGIDVGLLFGLTPETADLALKVNFGVPLYAPRKSID